MSQSQPGKEQRAFPRFPEEVSIEISNIAYPLPEGPREEGICQNIAKDGIGFTVPSPYESKALLSLNIYLKGWLRHNW